MLCCYLFASKVCPCLVVNNSSSCFLQVSSMVTESQCRVFKVALLLDQLVDTVVACQRACVFLDRRDCDRFLMCVVQSLRVVWVVVLCIESCVVGRFGLVLCCEADRHISMHSSKFSSCSPLDLSFCEGVAVFGVEVTGSCCRGVGWNVIISFTLAAQSLLLGGIEPKWPPSLRQPICWPPSLRFVVASSAVCSLGFFVSLWFAKPIRVVMFVISSQHASFTPTLHGRVSFAPARCWVVGDVLCWLSESCCRGVDRNLFHSGSSVMIVVSTTSNPKRPPSLRHSKSWSPWHWLVVGLSAWCCVSILGLVCCRVVDSVLGGMAGLHCRGVDRNMSCCRDAEWHISIYRLVHSAPSSFGRCQVACNLARAGLMWFIFATMTAYSPPCSFFLNSSIHTLTLGFWRRCEGTPRSGNSGHPFLHHVSFCFQWFSCSVDEDLRKLNAHLTVAVALRVSKLFVDVSLFS